MAAAESRGSSRQQRILRAGGGARSLDRFKEVNDRLGHSAGDELLVQVGSRLQRIVRREGDFVARLGGDEMLLALRDLPEERIAAVVERAREVIEEPVQLGGERVEVGASIGLAHGGPGSRIDQLLERADSRMYADKERRRGKGAPRGGAVAGAGS